LEYRRFGGDSLFFRNVCISTLNYTVLQTIRPQYVP
jgi:hypothetical protein